MMVGDRPLSQPGFGGPALDPIDSACKKYKECLRFISILDRNFFSFEYFHEQFNGIKLFFFLSFEINLFLSCVKDKHGEECFPENPLNVISYELSTSPYTITCTDTTGSCER